MDDVDLELMSDKHMEWNEDMTDSDEHTMTDGEKRDSPFRPLKSLRMVLSDLLTSEMAYLSSLELLSQVYLKHLETSSHVPSFLHGATTTVFPHTRQLHTFQTYVHMHVECSHLPK